MHVYFICALWNYLRLAAELSPMINDLEGAYKQLLKFQQDAVIDAGTPPTRTKLGLVGCPGLPTPPLRNLSAAYLKSFQCNL